jgi:teichuronic acid biosynthesis glycosyltransferase TuaC
VNVLVASHIYPSQAYPSRGTFVHNQALFLQSLCRLEIVAPVPWFPALSGFGRWSAYGRVARSERLDGMEIMHPRYVSFPRRVLFDLAWRFYLLMLRRSVKTVPDIIHAHFAYPDGLAAVEYGRQIGRPVVISVHGYDVRELPKANPRWRVLIHKALTKADAVIASSEDIRRRVLDLGVAAQRIHAIPQGVDCELFRPGQRRSVAAGGCWRLLYVGRFDKRKGLGVLLEAVAHLQAAGQDVCLTMVGGDPVSGEAGPFRRQAEWLGIQDRAEFVDAVPWQEVTKYMAETDIFVLPSYYDSFGIVLIEAMACGKPVVATRCGGPNNIVEPGTGVLVEVGDSGALAQGIQQVINQYDQYSPEVIRGLVEERYDYRQVARGIKAVYDSLVV